MDVAVGKNGKDVSFGQLHFGSACLGDARRTKRLVKIADQIMAHPGGSLPHKRPGKGVRPEKGVGPEKVSGPEKRLC